MSNTDNCGSTDTNDGEPCEQPATKADGRCHIHTEVDNADDGDPGRPSKLADHWDDIMAGARQGMTIEGCARLAGVSKKTLYNWKNNHEEFAAELRRARAHGELQHLQSVNDRGSQFILERSFGYVKTEKREVEAEHTHDASEQYADLVGAASDTDE